MNPADRVLVVGAIPPPIQGAAVVTAAVADYFDSRHFDVQIANCATLRSGPAYHLARGWHHLRAGYRIARWRPDWVYFSGAGGLSLYYVAALVIWCRLLRIPALLHHHNYSYLTETATAMRLISRGGGRNLRHVLLSHGMAQLFQQRYGAQWPVRVLSNAAVIPALPSGLGPSGPPRLGLLSNLSAAKGLYLALEVHTALSQNQPAIELHLAGPCDSDQDRRAIQAAQAHSNAVIYRGPLDRGQVSDFFDSIDVLVFASSYRLEAAPLVVLEAAARGVPTVSTAIGALPELQSQLGGLTAEPHPQDFVALLSERLDDLVTRRRSGGVASTYADLHRRAVADLGLLDPRSWPSH